MTADGDKTLQRASSSVGRRGGSAATVVSTTDEYITGVQRISQSRLADLDEQIRATRRRETILWWLFVLAFTLTLAAGSVGVALIFLGSLKVAIASGAAGLIPGCTSAWLKREGTTLVKNRQAIEAKLDGELRLHLAAASIADLPSGSDKRKLQVDYTRKMISRIPK